jgi:hypothetical protein
MQQPQTPLEVAVQTLRLGEQTIRVMGLDDLITIKRSLGRPKDLESLQYLLAIKELTAGSGAGD